MADDRKANQGGGQQAPGRQGDGQEAVAGKVSRADSKVVREVSKAARAKKVVNRTTANLTR